MMNRRSITGAALALCLGAALTACAEPEPARPSIREIIDTNASLSTLARALATAGVMSLSEPGPWTVFAPRNSAFEKLPEGELDRLFLPENRAELTRILQLHVIAGRYSAADLVNRTTTLTTLSGLNVIIDGFVGINIGGVAVAQPDVLAGNGVIHIIDSVILP